MRLEGILTKWNDERGFGFISPTKGGQPDVFVHVSAFPKDGQRPSVGELLTYEIETDNNGKKRATNLLLPNRVIRLTPRQRKPSRRHEKPSFLGLIVSFAIVFAVGIYGYGKYVHSQNIKKNSTSAAFHCDGRTYCSQMTSCAEAKFFLENCPNVQMDGNYDGVPCEQQWCK